MISISFTPAMSGDQCVISLPFSNVAERRKIEVRTLAECEAAFRDACEFARTISSESVWAEFKGTRERTQALVSVHLAWISRERKPSGFLKRSWSRYVPAAESVPQAAE